MKNLGRVMEDMPGFKEKYVLSNGTEVLVSTINLEESLGANVFNQMIGSIGNALSGTAVSGEETGVFLAGPDGWDSSSDGTLIMTNGEKTRQRALDQLAVVDRLLANAAK